MMAVAVGSRAGPGMLRVSQVNHMIAASVRGMHSTGSLQRARNWRVSYGLPERWNSARIFADTPDWSFADGRPAPLNTNQKKRYLQQIEYTKTIVKYLNELECAKAAAAAETQEVELRKERIMSGKFSPKGVKELKLPSQRGST
uniref:Large ribosomal subunit protein mL52 n=1 Tax=Ixodes ricinus TaxID=34613 RepID=A0A6B0UU73_IXORI